MSAANTVSVRCANCGAPIVAAASARWVTCPSCDATNQLGRGGGVVSASAAIPEQARLARLRAQRGLPSIPPRAIAHLFARGQIGPRQRDEAQRFWQDAHEQLASRRALDAAVKEDLETRLCLLTIALCEAMRDAPAAERRALLEQALAVVERPRLHHVLMARLTKLVARAGEIDTASAWLATHFDRRSDDIDIDSAYRSTAALLALIRGDVEAVFAAIGRGLDDVPIASELDLECVMIRAQALELCGQIELASDQLVERFMRTAHGQEVAVERASGDALLPLAHSLQPALTRLSIGADEVSVVSAGAGRPAACVGLWALIVAGCAVAIGLVVPRLHEGAAVVFVLLVVALGLKLGWRALMRLHGASSRRRGALRRRGVAGRARVVSRRALPAVIATRVELELLVSLAGRPRYGARHREVVDAPQLSRADPGQNLKVLVDPQDPQRMAIDWT